MGKRVFMDANSREQFPMEAGGEEMTTLQVGRFVFSKAAFDKAASIIRHAISKDGWLIIDEIGPLELRGEGFSEVLKEVLARRKKKILLVVRNGLTEAMLKQFAFDADSVSPDSLHSLQ
jgi:nucleoside-triphosphatase THEP1